LAYYSFVTGLVPGVAESQGEAGKGRRDVGDTANRWHFGVQPSRWLSSGSINANAGFSSPDQAGWTWGRSVARPQAHNGLLVPTARRKSQNSRRKAGTCVRCDHARPIQPLPSRRPGSRSSAVWCGDGISPVTFYENGPSTSAL